MTEPRTTTASAELTRIHYPPRPGLNGPTSFLLAVTSTLGVLILGGYIAAAYKINFVLDFAVLGPSLIVAAAVTGSAALLAHSGTLDRRGR